MAEQRHITYPSQILVGLILYLAAGTAWAADPEVQPEDLRRGLITVYRDNGQPTPGESIRLEPTITLSLKSGEAPHPGLRADGGAVVWKGHVTLFRGGVHRFQVRLRGQFRLRVAGKEVLAGEVKGGQAALVEGAEVMLEPGVHPIVAEFTRLPGVAQVELFWQSPRFRREPLPFDHLGHVAAQEDAALTAAMRIEQGRFLAEESNCIRCHRPADGDRMAQTLASRQGPDLSQVGRRVHAGWIEQWLHSPTKLRAGAVMPEMFSHDAAGRVDRHAVALYLSSLGGPVPTLRRENRGGSTRGKRLFSSLGCIACHGSGPDEEPERKEEPRAAVLYAPPMIYPLTGLGSKTTTEQMARYLLNPLAIDPSGRMPHMLLQFNEAQDLARYLCASTVEGLSPNVQASFTREEIRAAFRRVDSRPEELTAFEKLPEAEQWKDLGKRVVIDKGCNHCHTIAPGGKGFASTLASATLEDLKSHARQDQGCLANDASKRGKAPAFAFRPSDREALRAFLGKGLQGAGSPAPAYAARQDLRRFNCLACHSRDGEGGLTTQTVEMLRKYENAENAEAVSPPPLTGVGHKLRTPWLRQVLVNGVRARPWMGLRMPQFGEANIGRLPEGLAALEGTEPDGAIHKVELTAARIDAGRHLVGKNAFGCISCHDLAGIPNTGTRGPDLAGMNQRVRYDWYLRWLEQPQRMQAGTRMPTVFQDGKTQLDRVLDGTANAQAEAMWGYLSLGPGLPMPDGLEPRKGMVLAVADRPVLLRTFMPEAGARAVAIGFPGGVAAAFDAHTCRLAYAWAGEFLDASPVWADRGGNPARVLGARIWTAPAGCPLAVNNSLEPPDFAAQARDPAYGGSVPEGKVYDGPALLGFDGYSTDSTGVPTFRYHLQVSPRERVEVSERIEALRTSVAVGLVRRFQLQTPGNQTPWLQVGEANRELALLEAGGTRKALDVKTGRVEMPAAGHMLVMPQGDRVIILALTAAPEGSRWLVQRMGNTWQALLYLPPRDQAAIMKVDLNVWSPYRDDPALLKELAGRK
jgi:cbb3-type cytochrome oxidase cytochrome c subunit